MDVLDRSGTLDIGSAHRRLGIAKGHPIGRRHRTGGRYLADRFKDCPRQLGLCGHGQPDLSNLLLITPPDPGHDPIPGPLGPRIVFQSTPASSCRIVDFHARQIRASETGSEVMVAVCSARWRYASASASEISRLVSDTTVCRFSLALVFRSLRRSSSRALRGCRPARAGRRGAPVRRGQPHSVVDRRRLVPALGAQLRHRGGTLPDPRGWCPLGARSIRARPVCSFQCAP
jgi:hypothetical protein